MDILLYMGEQADQLPPVHGEMMGNGPGESCRPFGSSPKKDHWVGGPTARLYIYMYLYI